MGCGGKEQQSADGGEEQEERAGILAQSAEGLLLASLHGRQHSHHFVTRHDQSRGDKKTGQDKVVQRHTKGYPYAHSSLSICM